MFNTLARTVRQISRVEGRGLHSGNPVSVELRPCAAGLGLGFWFAGERHAVALQNASAGPGRSFLGPVSTPEHLLAVVLGLGITDLDMHLSAPELPGLDGSAVRWLEALGEPVITGETTGLVVDRPVEVEAFGGRARLEPCDRLRLSVAVDFGGPYRSSLEWDGCIQSIAPARTFCMHRDLEQLEAGGVGRGLGPGSVIVLGPRGALVPLRSADEWVRHKILDLLGDLALVGCPLRARVHVERGSHQLHQALLREWAPGPRPSRSG